MALAWKVLSIDNGPSKHQLELAVFDAVPEVAGRDIFEHREGTFVVRNESGKRLPVYERKFDASIAKIARVGDLDSETTRWEIEGEGGFKGGSPFSQEIWDSGRQSASLTFTARFSTKTRKGTIELYLKEDF